MCAIHGADNPRNQRHGRATPFLRAVVGVADNKILARFDNSQRAFKRHIGMETATTNLESVMASLFKIVSGLIRDLTALYRPERHYMRGPGPAWRAKHPEA